MQYSNEPDSTSVTQTVNSEEEVSISIVDLLEMMLKYLWLIVALAIIGGVGSYIYTKVTSVPYYNSTGTLYINTQREQKNDDINTYAIAGSAELMPTYIEVLKSKSFLNSISDQIDNKYNYAQIQKITKMSAVGGTNILEISVTATDAHDAYSLCSAFINLSPDELMRVFEGGSVKVVDIPEENPHAPILENAVKRGMIGLIAGALLGVVIIFIINLFDTRVTNSEELSKKYGFPILGEITNLSDK